MVLTSFFRICDFGFLFFSSGNGGNKWRMGEEVEGLGKDHNKKKKTNKQTKKNKQTNKQDFWVEKLQSKKKNAKKKRKQKKDWTKKKK